MPAIAFFARFFGCFLVGLIVFTYECWYHDRSVMLLFEHWFPASWIAFVSTLFSIPGWLDEIS